MSNCCLNNIDCKMSKNCSSSGYTPEFLSSTLAFNCNLDIFNETGFRGNGIVCTVGPACADVSTIAEMIKSGMCIARFNFSHGAHEDHKKMMDLVREAADSVSSEHLVALALDTKGPEIRTGLNKDGSNITLKKDDTVILTIDDAYKESCSDKKIYIDYKKLCESIKVGQIILVSDGNLVLETLDIKGNDVTCKVISGYTFGSRKNVCLPRVKVDLPALSSKDIKDIEFGMSQKVDIIFASFIRTGDNVRELRKLLDTTEHGKHIKIISKIEDHEGVENIVDIIDASDGIMIARGDLGMNLNLETIAVAQKKLTSLCNLKGKPVICATQMLESMIMNYRPTRAEVSDVTNAIMDGADCVMLSGESANGKYPVQAVKVMHSICVAAASMQCNRRLYEDIKNSILNMNEQQAIAMAAVSISYKLNASAIIVLTRTGSTAHIVSMFRPNCLIFCVTRDERVARGCHLYRNIYPIYYKAPVDKEWSDDVDARFRHAIKVGTDIKHIKVGSKVILLSGWKSGPGSSNTIRVVSVKEGYTFQG